MTGYALALPLLLVALSLAPPTEGEIKGPTKLPSFVHRCSIKDPLLNECALEAGRDAMPKLIRGYQPLRLPSLDPLSVDGIHVSTGTGPSSLNMESKNVVITGLAGADIKRVEVDPKKKMFTLECLIPRLQILTDYTVDGRILVLPVKGDGKANFTFDNANVVYKQPYNLVKRGNQVFQDLLVSHATFNTTRAYLHLDNLFNGDKVLGESINKFLDENWREILEDIAEPFVEAAAQIGRQIILSIASTIPYNEIFLDTE